MKKIISFKSGNEKSCIAEVSINSLNQFSIEYIFIENVLYDYKRVRTEGRERVLLDIIDKYSSCTLNQLFNI